MSFVSKSDIGFGTIVGSAVFNVLFVIGLCALVVPDGKVPLTWWPLFRDCMYYIFGLLVLANFVKKNPGESDGSLNAYESALLFCCYLMYVTIMYFNEPIEKATTKARLRRVGERVVRVGAAARDATRLPAAPTSCPTSCGRTTSRGRVGWMTAGTHALCLIMTRRL